MFTIFQMLIVTQPRPNKSREHAENKLSESSWRGEAVNLLQLRATEQTWSERCSYEKYRAISLWGNFLF